MQEEEEDYSKWSIEKFCRLIERWREGALLAATRDAEKAYDSMRQPALKAFQELHPRAYKNWVQRSKKADIVHPPSISDTTKGTNNVSYSLDELS